MRPILVANWKNYPESLSSARSLANSLSKKRALYKKTSLFIAPPSVYYELITEKTRSFASLAAQDIFPRIGGPYTGSITPDILKNFGVRLAIIGHSERRALGETEESIRGKTKFAIHSGITALVCVGERVRDEDGEHFEYLRRQVRSAIEGLNKKKDDLKKLAFAYEPVWAIGKRAKDAIKPKDLAEAVMFIRKILADTFGREVALSIPILYGGSVEPANAGTLMHETGVRGFLVGHSSLVARDFQTITESIINK
jgi:triosephosphate isomerase (TIM)